MDQELHKTMISICQQLYTTATKHLWSSFKYP